MAVGCGGGDDSIAVTGTVKMADGSPIKCENGMVIFQPAGSGQAASGSVDQDGSFTMMTKVQGDGVKPGQYKVVLQLWKSYRAGTLAVPKKYGDAATTPLEATVDADHAHFDFKVEPGE
jgi:hypothetical protein